MQAYNKLQPVQVIIALHYLTWPLTSYQDVVVKFVISVHILPSCLVSWLHKPSTRPLISTA